ncbi:MAG: ParB protein [Bacteroidota bacterium]|nr:ParB protein [Bacteroidota bacterium]
MTQKKIITGLGKGLGALLPSIEFRDKGFKVGGVDEDFEGNIPMIEVSKISHNPYQPRHDFNPEALEGLKKSIQEHGVIQPITVRRAIGGYELISGERRLRASIAAGLHKMPAYILDIDHGVEMLELALIENVQREDLNPIETANGYQRLIEECKLTQESVALKIGKDRSTITNFLRLLKLPEKIQESLRSREISMGHARALLALGDTESILKAFNEVIENSLSVRATEKLVKDIESGRTGTQLSVKKSSDSVKNGKAALDAETQIILNDMENQLRLLYGTKVKITPKSRESGNIEFEFYSKDDLERLIELFSTIEAAI